MLKLNGQKIEVTLFPDKTAQVWKLDPELLKKSTHLVDWEFSQEAELLHLAQLKALLDVYKKPTQLHIRYLPYGRQDKEVANEATFALRPFAQLLNSMGFDEVTIDDPHSSVALSLIHKSRAIYPVEQVQKIIKLTGADLVCYPDKGARTRYSAIYQFDSIYGEKVRDQLTGQITACDVVGLSAGKRILVIDDICDGGATFNVLARNLLAAGALSVDLFVTHGLFSKGLAPLFQSGLRRIFTQKGEATENQNHITYKEILS